MKPQTIINRILNLLNALIKVVRLLFSYHFYVEFFSSLNSIRHLIKYGGFLIETKYFHEPSGKEISISSRFQADGDIINMLPTSVPETDLESICKFHLKKLKQKLDSIWFAPRFILLLVGVAVLASFNWSFLFQKLYCCIHELGRFH